MNRISSHSCETAVLSAVK